MEARFWTALIASGLAAGVTSAGIYTIRRFEKWAQQNSTYFIYFAAGVLIAASFLHIIPKAFSTNPQAPGYLLGGYFAMHLFNHFITAFVCEKSPEPQYAIGLVAILGIGFYSFIDGLIYSVTFTVSVLTGVLSTLGMVLHEFPEGIITYLLLLRSGFNEQRALLLSFLVAAISTPLGMVVSYPFVSQFDQPIIGASLVLSAGALVYVGATHLLPQAERAPTKYSFIALGGGVAVAVIVTLTET